MEESTANSCYHEQIQNTFGSIYCELGDPTHDKPLLADIPNRSEILFMQYEMEKKGKNLGLIESRLLKIQEGKLFQVSQKGQEKELPPPSKIVMVKRGGARWSPEYQQYKGFIVLQFQGRTDVTVYFKEVVEWREIGMFLQAGIQKRKGLDLTKWRNLWKISAAQNFAKKIGRMKEESADIRQLRVKRKINDIFKLKLSDRALVKALLQSWKSKVVFQNRELHLTLQIKELRLQTPINGSLKLWSQRMVDKILPVSSQNTSKLDGRTFYSYMFKNLSEYRQKLDSSQQFQFEVDCGIFLLKSQNFNGHDLAKLARQYSSFEVNLMGKGQMASLVLGLNIEGIVPLQNQLEITPQHYRVIDDLYVKGDLRFELTQIHQFYLKQMQQAKAQLPYYVNFNRFRQLFDMLKVEELIGKFYLVAPFKDYVGTKHRGQAVFDYFSADAERDLFYDVEKIIWKHQAFQFREILSALKSFDQNPKFNFTQPFLFIVAKMRQIAQNASLTRWRADLFQKGTRGINAMAFFLALSVVKSFTSIFVYQQFPSKRALPYNTLLFGYLLKKEVPALWSKFQQIQFNVEAYFGQHFVSLFSKLLSGDVFSRVLIMALEERQKQPQILYIFGMISVFISLLEMVDELPCAYLSGQHYILTFEEVCSSLQDKHRLFEREQYWREVVTVRAQSKEYQQLEADMTQFYLNNSYTGQFGEISRQIYQEFLCYHYKNELDMRKIFIVIDKIHLNEPTSDLNLTIFQSATKVYEHNFKGIDLDRVQHFVQLKLSKLEELNLICTTSKNSFSCRLDPKEVPSNLYYHMVKPLVLTYHMSPECNRHIFMQVYIKDNCQIQSLQNNIPNKYRQILLEDGVDKDDIVFCKRFARSFRMAENNFNLLYSKLGWYGCHYLVPDDRMVGLQVVGLKQAGEEELRARVGRLSRFSRVLLGKAVIPQPTGQTRPLNIDILKENILTSYPSQQLSSHFSDMNVYSSASRLLSYCLDNFSIPCSTQFMEFYQNMTEKLPLIDYLSYQPKQFYYLPSFTFQVFCSSSASTITISEKGPQFISQFSAEQATRIEEGACSAGKLPLEMEFGYVDRQMFMDQFLHLLRLNILKRLAEGGEKKGKGRRWPNSLQASAMAIPNYQLRYFYQVMNQTKQIVQFQFKQVSSRIGQPVQYEDWGLVHNRWVKVHCLAQLNASGQRYYYVSERRERKKYILEDLHLIRTGDRPCRKIELSEDIAHSMEVISYELNKIFAN